MTYLNRIFRKNYVFSNGETVSDLGNRIGEQKASIYIVGYDKPEVQNIVTTLQYYGFGVYEQYTAKDKPINIKYYAKTKEYHATLRIFHTAPLLNIENERDYKDAERFINYLQGLKSNAMINRGEISVTETKKEHNHGDIDKLTVLLTEVREQYKANTAEPKSETLTTTAEPKPEPLTPTAMNIRPASKRGLKRPTGMMAAQ